MDLNQALGMAIRDFRIEKGLTQEDFSEVSSRTYLSILERGMKSPTIEKVDQLCSVMNIHPKSLVERTYDYLTMGKPESGRPVPAYPKSRVLSYERLKITDKLR